jgi:outer membrane protein assembly factor BamE
MRILFIALAITFLSACGFVGFPGVYKINVEQGNIIDQEMADQLKPGMSRRQVRFILGTPLVEDTFNPDRWDYLYVKRNGADILSESHLTITFEGDTLLSVTGDYLPPAWREDEDVAAPNEINSSPDAPESDEKEPDSAG